MAAPHASSRLEMLQARFQQRQLAEKEQKLLQLYDQQQLRAHQVAQRGSAGSNGSNSSSHGNSGNVSHHQAATSTNSTSNSQGGGKVRQMFDERRHTTVKGIDKSYPLEPLDNRSRKHQTTTTSNVFVNSSSSSSPPPLKNGNPMSNRRSLVTRRTVRSEAVNGNVNNGKPVVSYHEEVSQEISDSTDRDNEQDEFSEENIQVSRYENGNRRIDRPAHLGIEEVTNENTNQRHATTAKIHSTELDRSEAINRTCDNLENEQFPDDDTIDVPERSTRPSSAGNKPTQTETRHERLKNFNTKKIGQSTKQIAGNTTSFTKKRNETTVHSGSSSRASTVTRRMEEEILRASSTSPELEAGTEEPRNLSPKVSDNRGKFKIFMESRSPVTKTSGMVKVSQIFHKNSTDYYPRRKSEFEKSKTFRKLQLELEESSPEPYEPDQVSSILYGKQGSGKRSSIHDENIYSSERRSFLDRAYAKDGKISQETSPERPGSRRGNERPNYRRESLISSEERKTTGGGIKKSSFESSTCSSRRRSSSSSPIVDYDFPKERKTSHQRPESRTETQSPIYRRESIVKSEERKTTSGGVKTWNIEFGTCSSRPRSQIDRDSSKERNKSHEKSSERSGNGKRSESPVYRRESKIKNEDGKRTSGGIKTSSLDSSTYSSMHDSSSWEPVVNRDYSKERKTSHEMSHQGLQSPERSHSPAYRRQSMMKNEEQKTTVGGEYSSTHCSRRRSSDFSRDDKKMYEKSPERGASREGYHSPTYHRRESVISNEEIGARIEKSNLESSTYSSRLHSSSPTVNFNLPNERITSHEISHERRGSRGRSHSPNYSRESIFKNKAKTTTSAGIRSNEFDSSTYSSRQHSFSSGPIIDHDFPKERKTSNDISHENPVSRDRSQSPIYRRQSIVKNDEKKLPSEKIEASSLRSSTYSSRHHSSSPIPIAGRNLSIERKSSHDISHQGIGSGERSQSPNYQRGSIIKNYERETTIGGGVKLSNFDSSTYSSRHHSSAPIPSVDSDFSEKQETSHEISHQGRESRERSQSPNYRRESIVINEERNTTIGRIRASNFDSSTCSSRHHSSSPIPCVDPDFSDQRKTSHEISHQGLASSRGRTQTPTSQRESYVKNKETKVRSEDIVKNDEGRKTSGGRKRSSLESSTFSSRCHSSSPTPMVDYDISKERKTSREKSPERPAGSRRGSQSPRESMIEREDGKNKTSNYDSSTYCSRRRSSTSGSFVERDFVNEREPSDERRDSIAETSRKSVSSLRSCQLVKKLVRPSGPEKKTPPTATTTTSFERKITLDDIEFPAESSKLGDATKISKSSKHKIIKKDKALMKITKQDKSIKTREGTNSRDARSGTISPSPPSPGTTRETVSFGSKKSERKSCGDAEKIESKNREEFDEYNSPNDKKRCNVDYEIGRSTDEKNSRRWSAEISVKRDDTFKVGRPSSSGRVLKIDNEKFSEAEKDLSFDNKIRNKDKSQLLERIEKIRSTLSRTGRSEQNLDSKEFERTDSVESALKRFDSIGVETEHRVTVGVDETDIFSSKPSSKSFYLSSGDKKKVPVNEKRFVKKIIKPLCKLAKASVAPMKAQPRKNDVKTCRVASKEKLARVNLREKHAQVDKSARTNKKDKSIITATTPRHSDNKMANKSREGRKRMMTSIVKKSKLHDEESSGRGEGTIIDGSPICKRKLFQDSESEIENENSRSTVVLTSVARVTNNSPEIIEIETINNGENVKKSVENISRTESSLGDSRNDNDQTKVLRSIEDIRKSIKRESQDFNRELKKFNTAMRRDAESSRTENPHSIVSSSGIVSCVRITKTLKSGDRKPVVKIERSTVKLPIARRVAKSPSPDIGTKRLTEGRARTTSSTLRRSVPSSPAKSPDTTNRRYASSELKSPGTKSLGRTSSSPGWREAKNHTEFSTTTEYSDITDGPVNNSKFIVTEIVSTITTKKNNDALVTDLDDCDVSGSNEENRAKSAIRKRSSERSLTSRKHNETPTNTPPPLPRPTSALISTSGINSKSKMSTKTKSSTSNNGPKGTATENDGLSACKICGRRFNSDRVTRHEQICSKTTTKKRKQFDATIHRVKGTELEPFVKKGGSKKNQADRKAQKPEVKSNWRRKHEDFINAIRSAKQVQAHLAAGGKLSDLPPPPPSDTSDYVQCPHCGRKFAQAAADRHIPKCQSMMHNKPNPRAPPKPKR